MVFGSDTGDQQPVVLLVEDEIELATLYSEYLGSACEVRVAHDGDEALELIDHDLDLAFLDRRLADWSGDELVNVIRERGIDCAIIMVSAVTPDEDIVDLPADDYLQKPVSMEDLRNAVVESMYRLLGGNDRREFLALVSRKIALENEMDAGELEQSKEYRKLKRRIRLAEERLEFDHINLFSKYRPEACPECGLRWDVRVDETVGFVKVGSMVWKCRGCGNVVNLPDATDRKVAKR